jgi:hypothetical protein
MRRFSNVILKGTQTTAEVVFVLPNRATQIDITNPSGVTSSTTTLTADEIVTFTFSSVSAEEVDRITESGDFRELEQNTDERIIEDSLTLFSNTISVEYTYPQTTETVTFSIVQIV